MEEVTRTGVGLDEELTMLLMQFKYMKGKLLYGARVPEYSHNHQNSQRVSVSNNKCEHKHKSESGELRRTRHK